MKLYRDFKFAQRFDWLFELYLSPIQLNPLSPKAFRDFLRGDSTKELAIFTRFFLEGTGGFCNFLRLSISAYFNLFKPTLNNALLMIKLLKVFRCREKRLAIGNQEVSSESIFNVNFIATISHTLYIFFQ